MAVIYSGSYQFKCGPVRSKIPAGRCILDIVRYDNGMVCVMMTESKENKGVSVTSACDRIATQVHADFLADVPAARIVWLEHTPASRIHKAHIDLIQFQHEARGNGPSAFSGPRWQRFFEAAAVVQQEFLKTYGYILKELASAYMILEIEDKGGHSWRVWANQDSFFIVATNLSAELPACMLDVGAVTGALKKNERFFDPNIRIEEQFTTALMKGFLNKGL